MSRSAVALLLFTSAALAQVAPRPAPLALGNRVYEDDSGLIVAADASGTLVFENWGEYLESEFFLRNGLRCGATDRTAAVGGVGSPAPSDCSMTLTNPASIYDPSNGVYTIPVVVHVLIHSNGSGNITDAMIQSQIDVLNEDYLALTGSLGSNGTYSAIQFALASTDPSGNATNGITRTVNSNWYNDSGSYYNTLAWDTNNESTPNYTGCSRTTCAAPPMSRRLARIIHE